MAGRCAAGWVVAVAMLLARPAIAQSAPFPPPGLATVAVAGTGEFFVVRVNDVALLDEMWAISMGLSLPRIVVGQIASGNGGYNGYGATPWSWHLDENTLALADFTIELCDGRPSFVENDFGYGGGWFCPWGSIVVDVRADDSLPADTNVDGAVDQSDADRIAACLTPPGGVCWQSTTACCQGDVDSDTDVDCDDWALLESQWTEASAPVPPASCVGASPVPSATMPWLGGGLLVLGSRLARHRRGLRAGGTARPDAR